ncbi:hypothetical protein PSN13_06497 [Micromonospora saelicesensis]|uniref:Uncharacterized protein n=1 Tax=Micromonospora saelicesensis TaxID=285676 RepID=A0A328NBS1_9ACTN|nr:hypothetical protein [Micromonospora saelicesensis]RAO26469.1 hypothetical protein PSN13_06497 [Micromonospora saelicesensis]
MEGWEPSTVYEHNADGRLVRSTPEPEWNDQQVALLVALEEYEAGLCKRCGTDLVEATDPAHDFNNPLATAVYLPAPGTPVQCHCCAALERSEQQTGVQNPQFPAAIMHAVQLVRRG